MGLLHEIQESVVKEGSDLGSILLKLRLLASRLGSDSLEEWVKHESEGYPKDVDVPSYRKVGVSYRGSFSGPFGTAINNAPIPTYLVNKYAGEKWVSIDIRESISAVGDLAKATEDGGGLSIDSSNLILLLQGKVYKDYSCIDIQSSISVTAMLEIQQAVRSRILELTLQLEKSVPASTQVEFGEQTVSAQATSEKVQQISQQIIYGNVTTAVTGGHGSNINVTIEQGDTDALVEYLVHSGIPKSDASELATIMQSESPGNAAEPLGERARQWLLSNIEKAAKGIWRIGVTVATRVISEAALRYYGLK